MPSLKSFRGSKSAKTAKSTKASTDEGGGGRGSAERRIVLYEGSSFHTQSGIKLKKNALYELLGVPITATQNEIKKAYRQKALQLHPDKNVNVINKEELNEKLGQINRAYKILSDPTKRKIYDQYGIDAVQTFEETEISPSWLWFVYTRLGRIASCVVLLFTCCFCCFCCCACFCDCFCGCCCNRCCKDKHDDQSEDGYMRYDPEAAQPPPPPKSKLASIINSISSKRVIKKKKRTQSKEECGIPMTENPDGRPESIRVESRLENEVCAPESNEADTNPIGKTESIRVESRLGNQSGKPVSSKVESNPNGIPESIKVEPRSAEKTSNQKQV